MKQLLYVWILLLCSCSGESLRHENPGEGDEVQVSFRVDVPEAELLPTRAVNENSITGLQLLVFDENGRFISRHEAVLSGYTFTAVLPQSSRKRIVHFIGNYGWNAFDDEGAVYKDEGELIAPLQSTGLIFWQRLVLNSGIYAGVLSGQPVALLRNMAKFSLENRTLSGLANVSFAVFNKASAGSVAPFNTANRAFEQVVTEPVGVTFTDNSPFGVDNIYVFERRNSIVTTDPTFVIVRGAYAGVTCYYKIDIVDESKNVYDIQRNVWYKIVIESVAMVGYLTLEAAISSPASNNISASVLLQSYPTISDGSYVLSVDKTAVSFTSNGQTLQANATYKTVGGVSQNSLVTVSLVQDVDFPLVNGNVSYDVATGNITAAINDVPASGAARSATVKIEAGNLSRTIRLRLHAPFVFTNVSMTPSVVANVSGASTVLKFTVPAEAEYLLPFNCYISSAYLTPDFGNIEVVNEDGVYRYKWKVTAVGEQTVNFKTNVAGAAETVLIEADLFQRGQVVYGNVGGTYRFSNVVLTPNPVNFGSGRAVTLRFTVPTAGTYSIYTSNLTPVSGSVVGGIYTYTAVSPGEQVVNFTTNKQNVLETIRLRGTNYLDYTVVLKNQLVAISGVLTYGSSSRVINGGRITVSVGSNIVGIFNTTSTGGYQVSLEVKIGDILSFSYTLSGRTYTVTTTVSSALMTSNLRLL